MGGSAVVIRYAAIQSSTINRVLSMTRQHFTANTSNLFLKITDDVFDLKKTKNIGFVKLLTDIGALCYRFVVSYIKKIYF